MKVKLLFFSIFVFYLSGPGASVQAQKPFKAKVHFYQDSLGVNIVSFFQNDSSGAYDIRYQLNVNKKGRSGVSNTSQAGEMTIPPHEKKTLSTVHLNFTKGDIYRVVLKVFHTGQIIAVDNVEFPDKSAHTPNHCY